MSKSSAEASFLGSTAFLLAQLGREARDAWSEVLAERGLTPASHAILLVLRERGPLPLTELSESVRVDPRNMGPVLDALGSYIERGHDDTDRRRRTVGLTRSGRSAAEELAQATRQADESFLAPLNPTDRARLHRLLTTLQAAERAAP